MYRNQLVVPLEKCRYITILIQIFYSKESQTFFKLVKTLGAEKVPSIDKNSYNKHFHWNMRYFWKFFGKFTIKHLFFLNLF